METVGAWPAPSVSRGRRGGVARRLGPAWPQWGRALSFGPRVAAVKVWPVPWAPRGRRGCVAGPLGPA